MPRQTIMPKYIHFLIQTDRWCWLGCFLGQPNVGILKWVKKVQYCEAQELMFLHFICCLWCSPCTREERQIIFEFNFPFSIQFNSKCKNLQWKSLPSKWEKCTYIAHSTWKGHSYFETSFLFSKILDSFSARLKV